MIELFIFCERDLGIRILELKQFEHIGIELIHGFDADKLDADTVAGLNRAVKDADRLRKL